MDKVTKFPLVIVHVRHVRGLLFGSGVGWVFFYKGAKGLLSRL